ncbi:MAG: hypothetical protein CMB80_19860 [Flammeovirgaceae bacterium]|nr:hypothetical protein [Flammeovirgaceae bacterium]MBE63113.1 hypothetical protein [Flammeovirgaceae bacterium]MBR10790.1 hypothetical protein [Rickettsiales bacterium]
MRLILFSLVQIICTSILFSQSYGTVKGRVIDSGGAPLAFATVYEEGTTNGTTSNGEGYYQLTLEEGRRTIIAQFVGYQRKAIEVVIIPTENIQLDFQLEDEALMLQEVVVSAREKDHARQIIRNTIKKRKYYRDEVAAFACDVYLKGLQRLDKKPKSLLGMTIDIDTGIVYLSESVSKLKFQQPNKVNEVMISSKVSGNNNAFSYNQASELLINLYDNSFFVEGVSERPFISPIASNAFLYYDYKMAGTIIENGLYINKIRVIPKRATDPVFSGYIYIIEDSWRLYSVDVLTTKSNGIEFLDSLTFNQVFAPVGNDIWMPISQRFTFKFKVFGFQGSGHFTAVYRNYKVQPNYYIPKKEEKKTQQKEEATSSNNPSTPKPPTKKESQLANTTIVKRDEPPLFDKEDFKKAVLIVDENANDRDSAYWASVRPIPLTTNERLDYVQKDSIRTIKESKAYKDSIDKVRNKFKLTNLFLNGYTHYNSYEKRYINFPSLVEALQYNSVEGLVLNLPVAYQKRNETSFDYRIVPTIRYGFANQQFQAKVEGLKMLDLKKREMITAGGGRFISQLNDQNPISFTNNTYFSFIRGLNYAKFYQKNFGYISYQREIINGVLMTSRIEYEDRQQLENQAEFNILDRTFSSNIPTNEEIGATDFIDHQALFLSARFRIKFNQKYIDRPDRKIIVSSNIPNFYIYAKKAFPIFNSEVDFTLLKLGITHQLRLGQFGTSQIASWAGAFVGKKTLFFPDFNHFNGNQTYLTSQGVVNSFQVLRYYEFSTQDKFTEVHYEHHFNEFIFNKIPLVRRLNLQGVAGINYLTTPALGNYFEFGFGIEHIFRFVRVDYYSAIRNGDHYGSGVRVGIGF